MFFALGCILSTDTGDEPRTCDDVVADLQAEFVEIATCTDAAECGQELTGTSCGCTRNLIARLDADVSGYTALQAEAAKEECSVGTSPCDCPETYGFACEDNLCTWNYGEGTYLPSCEAADGDPYDVESVALAGDDLSIDLSYGGGCQTHSFTLCWPDQSYAESSPVQAMLELYHDDANDECDSVVSETVVVSLAPLQEAWHAAYGGGSGEITVHIGGETVAYTF